MTTPAKNLGIIQTIAQAPLRGRRDDIADVLFTERTTTPWAALLARVQQ